MSLINEALQKARTEAARREALEKGIPVDALPSHMPQRRRRALPLIALVAGVALASMALGAFLFAKRPAEPPAETVAPERTTSNAPADAMIVSEPNEAADPSAPDPTAATIQAEVPARTATPPSGAPPSPPVTTAPSIVPPPVSPPPPVVAPPPVAPVPVAPPPPVAASPPSPPVTPPIATVEPPPPVEPAPPPPPPAERVYLYEAEIPGTVRLKVDFIVWSTTRPLVQINGQLLEPGQRIDAFRVESIEEDRVVLDGDDGDRVIIRVPPDR